MLGEARASLSASDGTIPGIAGLALSYREADQALAIGRALLGGGRCVHFEHLGVQRLLFQLRDNPELASFYDDLLGKLQAHDERQGAELVNTLEAFFEWNGNHVRTAQSLHLHRNTLLYRLDRAQDGARRGPRRRRDAAGVAGRTKDRPRDWAAWRRRRRRRHDRIIR